MGAYKNPPPAKTPDEIALEKAQNTLKRLQMRIEMQECAMPGVERIAEMLDALGVKYDAFVDEKHKMKLSITRVGRSKVDFSPKTSGFLERSITNAEVILAEVMSVVERRGMKIGHLSR